jgi:hypothetical protein
LAFLAAEHALHNALWLKAEWPFISHPWYAGYLYPSFSFLEFFRSRDWPAAVSYLFKSDNADLYSLGAALVAVFDRSYAAMILTLNLPYLFLALLFVYKLGEHVSGRRTGLFAAGLFSLYPGVYGISRQYCEEFAVMCVSVFAVWCLLKSDSFRSRRYSLLFALALAWGMLIKYSTFVCLIGPVAAVLCFFRAGRPASGPARLVNFALSVTLFLILIGPKYFHPANLKAFALRPVFNPSPEAWHSVFNLQATLFAPWLYHLALPFFIVWSVSAVPWMRTADARAKWAVLLWMLVPWVSLILMRHMRNAYYLILVTPPMAIMSAYGLESLLKGRKARAVAAGLAALGLVQFYDFSFGTPLRLSQRTSLRVGERFLSYYYTVSPPICRPPERSETVLRKIRRLEELCGGREVLLLLSPNDPWGNHVWPVIFWFRGIRFVELPYYANFQRFDWGATDRVDAVVLMATPSDPDPSAWFANTLDRAADTIRNHARHPYFPSVESYKSFLADEKRKLTETWRASLAPFGLSEEIPIRENVTARVYWRAERRGEGSGDGL